MTSVSIQELYHLPNLEITELKIYEKAHSVLMCADSSVSTLIDFFSIGRNS